MSERFTDWRLFSTTRDDRARLVGSEVAPIKPPDGGFREQSADGCWLTVYGPPVEGHRPAMIETYTRTPVYRPRAPLS